MKDVGNLKGITMNLAIISCKSFQPSAIFGLEMNMEEAKSVLKSTAILFYAQPQGEERK